MPGSLGLLVLLLGDLGVLALALEDLAVDLDLEVRQRRVVVLKGEPMGETIRTKERRKKVNETIGRGKDDFERELKK